MRSLKTTGGMTHGSGMTDNQRALWTMSKVHNIRVQQPQCRSSQTRHTQHQNQHKASTEARMKRDAADLEKITSKLAIWSPFSTDSSLRNVVTGVVAEGQSERA